jgi:hypothetical protein
MGEEFASLREKTSSFLKILSEQARKELRIKK